MGSLLHMYRTDCWQLGLSWVGRCSWVIWWLVTHIDSLMRQSRYVQQRNGQLNNDAWSDLVVGHFCIYTPKLLIESLIEHSPPYNPLRYKQREIRLVTLTAMSNRNGSTYSNSRAQADRSASKQPSPNIYYRFIIVAPLPVTLFYSFDSGVATNRY